MYSRNDMKKIHILTKKGYTFNECIRKITTSDMQKYRTDSRLDKVRREVMKRFTIKSISEFSNSSGKVEQYARSVFSYVSKNIYNSTYQEIGRYLGKHHTTIMHSFKTIQGFLDVNDAETKRDIKKISEIIKE